MNTAQLNPYKITRGNTYKEVFTINYNGTPLDLTQYTTIQMDIRTGKSYESTLLHSVNLTNGIAVSGTDNNILTILISKEETVNWKNIRYYRDIIFSNSTETYTYLEGEIEVRQNITQL